MAQFTQFDVQVDDISGVVTNLTINAASSPTTTQVQLAISGSAAEVAAEALASGLDPSGLAATDAAYVLLQRAVIMKTAADVLVAKNRGQGDAGQYYSSGLWTRCVSSLSGCKQIQRTDLIWPSTFPSRQQLISRTSTGIPASPERSLAAVCNDLV